MGGRELTERVINMYVAILKTLVRGKYRPPKNTMDDVRSIVPTMKFLCMHVSKVRMRVCMNACM